MNLLYRLPRPVIFAHRGASAQAPENTLASFKLAEELGALAVELDVKLSMDGKVIVIHDPNTVRTTGVYMAVDQNGYKELSSLNAASHFPSAYVDQKIPLLEEVFELLGRRILINIELTNYHNPSDSLVEKTVTLVVKSGMQDCVFFSSFSPINLLKARRLLPDVPVGLLAQERSEGWWTRSLVCRWFFPAIIHPYYLDINRQYIQREHQRNRRVHAWTVNQKKDMQFLFKADIDGIFTDDPALAKKTLEEG